MSTMSDITNKLAAVRIGDTKPQPQIVIARFNQRNACEMIAWDTAVAALTHAAREKTLDASLSKNENFLAMMNKVNPDFMFVMKDGARKSFRNSLKEQVVLSWVKSFVPMIVQENNDLCSKILELEGLKAENKRLSDRDAVLEQGAGAGAGSAVAAGVPGNILCPQSPVFTAEEADVLNGSDHGFAGPQRVQFNLPADTSHTISQVSQASQVSDLASEKDIMNAVNEVLYVMKTNRTPRRPAPAADGNGDHSRNPF